MKSTTRKSHTWFCPSGHNVFTSSSYTEEHQPECGSCGSLMTTEPDSFDDLHAANEAHLIEKFENI